MNAKITMSSSRPYLVRGLNEWIIDNNLTPYLLVDAKQGGVHVPEQYVKDGKIVLNISPTAVRDLRLDNEHVEFNARFGGVAMNVTVPMGAVLAIYAKENGQGMVFSEDGGDKPRPPAGPAPKSEGNGAAKKNQKPQLRLVK